MEGVTGMMAWLGHVPGSCLGGVYGHADIDKPFFSYRTLRKTAASIHGGPAPTMAEADGPA